MVSAGLVVAGAVAMAFVVWAALAGLSFEPTDASEFKGWAAQPLGTAGGIALGCALFGLVSWSLSRRRVQLLALAGAALLVSGPVLVWGVVAHADRTHPEFDRARTLQTLVLPGAYTKGPTQLQHPSDFDPPAATRLWTAPLRVGRACDDLDRAIERWSDPGTVHRARSVSPQRCYISATRDGHEVDANVTDGSDLVTVSVRLSW